MYSCNYIDSFSIKLSKIKLWGYILLREFIRFVMYVSMENIFLKFSFCSSNLDASILLLSNLCWHKWGTIIGDYYLKLWFIVNKSTYCIKNLKRHSQTTNRWYICQLALWTLYYTLVKKSLKVYNYIIKDEEMYTLDLENPETQIKVSLLLS